MSYLIFGCCIFLFVSNSQDLEISGAVMFAPMVNPYDASMTKEEKYKTWEKWSSKRKLLYILARKLPSFLPYFYSKSFLSGEHGEPENMLFLSLAKKVFTR